MRRSSAHNIALWFLATLISSGFSQTSDCAVFVPSLDPNIFVAGEINTITWDVSTVPPDPCTLLSFELDSIHSVIITTLATDIDPLAGSLSFTIPASLSPDPYVMAFNAVDGRHATVVTIRD